MGRTQGRRTLHGGTNKRGHTEQTRTAGCLARRAFCLLHAISSVGSLDIRVCRRQGYSPAPVFRILVVAEVLRLFAALPHVGVKLPAALGRAQAFKVVLRRRVGSEYRLDS